LRRFFSGLKFDQKSHTNIGRCCQFVLAQTLRVSRLPYEATYISYCHIISSCTGRYGHQSLKSSKIFPIRKKIAIWSGTMPK
jgi:hypothetical protein